MCFDKNHIKILWFFGYVFKITLNVTKTTRKTILPKSSFQLYNIRAHILSSFKTEETNGFRILPVSQ